jgi:hypothetical protein
MPQKTAWFSRLSFLLVGVFDIPGYYEIVWLLDDERVQVDLLAALVFDHQGVRAVG